MTIFQNNEPLPPIPDDLSITQFFLDYPPRHEREVPWLIDDTTGRPVTLSEIRNRTTALSNGLASKFSIGYDDVVLIFSRNHIDYPIVTWATLKAGGIVSGANPAFTRDELVYQLKSSKANLIIANPESLNVAISAARAVGIPSERIVLFDAPDSQSQPSNASKFPTVEDLVQLGLRNPNSFKEPKIDPKTKLAYLTYSSGTTGRPKAVAIRHISLIANTIQMATHSKVGKNYTTWDEQRYRPGDVGIVVLPLFHSYGMMINLHFMLYYGMTVVVIPKFNFVEMLKSIIRYRINHLVLVPPQAVLLCKHPAVKDYDLRSVVRTIMVGAAPLSKEINEQLFELFPDAHIGQGYGMTEISTSISLWSIENKRGVSGSAGKLIPGVKARIVKPDGSLAGFNEPGELIIYSPSNSLRYHNNEQATKDTFIDGWVKTGDEAKIDENLELFILDRIKEIMKVRGFQVAPAELEGCILDHPDVTDACVVGVPDDYSGEVPLAFVVPTASTAARMKNDPAAAHDIKASIMKHVADNKVAYKQLAGGVEFIDAIPKNPSGKLLRRVLREMAKEIRQRTRSKL
ncbi:phenylacetyl- ligase [Moniliophthora roreri MCA 2997]|uniref:Phenylacetyl-ligase n=1 Tax=Moniliophthora roreri (strain MCA 2997) TaxID=1381753 RepID=V2WTZ1_MONRO|nr:phenylacetyl- ligase [Moniliophthora roreri MCA 2997]